MNELEWLTAERPPVAAPDEEATAGARAALLAHAARGMRVGAPGDTAPAGPARRRVTAGAGPARADARRAGRRPTGGAGPARDEARRAGRRRGAGPARDEARRAGRRRAGDPRRAEPRKAPLYALAAAVFAVAIVVVAGALPSGDGPARRIVGAPAPAEAALVTLAQRFQAAPAPTGDATLVLRSHHFPGGAKDFTGADLYLDDGRYFYGITLAELQDNASYGDLGEGVPKLEREAAKAAITLPAAQARRKMIDATFGPKGEPAPGTGVDKAAIAARDEKLKHLTGPTPTPAPKLMIDDNRVWTGAMDALIAGAGDPDVRAGVMRLLSTIAAVELSDHGATLDIRNPEFPDGYAETLTVDAQTGVIRKLTGGVPGKTPDVVVDYDIERVTASDILK